MEENKNFKEIYKALKERQEIQEKNKPAGERNFQHLRTEREAIKKT